jgi:hypothetical protein
MSPGKSAVLHTFRTSNVMQPVGTPFPSEKEKDRRFHSVLEGNSQKGVDYLRTAQSGIIGKWTARVIMASCWPCDLRREVTEKCGWSACCGGAGSQKTKPSTVQTA